MTPSRTNCLKCGYVRTAADHASPIDACPKCGAIYTKVEAALQARAAQDQARSAGGGGARASVAADLAAKSSRDPTIDDVGLIQIDARELRAWQMAHLVYATFLLGYIAVWAPFALVLTIVGVVIAYRTRTLNREHWTDAHFTWQIRTFWTVTIFGAFMLLIVFVITPMFLHVLVRGNVGLAVVAFVLGYPFMALGFAAGLWFLYRIIKGWIYLFKREPV